MANLPPNVIDFLLESAARSPRRHTPQARGPGQVITPPEFANRPPPISQDPWFDQMTQVSRPTLTPEQIAAGITDPNMLPDNIQYGPDGWPTGVGRWADQSEAAALNEQNLPRVGPPPNIKDFLDPSSPIRRGTPPPPKGEELFIWMQGPAGKPIPLEGPFPDMNAAQQAMRVVQANRPKNKSKTSTFYIAPV